MKKRGMIVCILMGGISLLSAQQSIKVSVQPETSRAIEGHLSLDRLKYFNLSSASTSIESKIGDQTLTDYYFKELEMTLGRDLGMVYSEVGWGNSVFEDPARPGYVDIPRLKNNLNPSNGSASQDFINTLSPNMDVANHDRHDCYPDWMPKVTHPEEEGQAFPENSDAAGELAATLLAERYTDWTRPGYYEPINEPSWRFWSNPKFVDFHTSIWEKNKELGTPTEVGGPCFSVGYFYKNRFGSMSSITDFMDRSDFKLDFYSWHIYDFMHWENDNFDFEGSVSTGLPTEGVFDAVANHTVNKYGEAFTYVGSEHGGYISGGMDEDAVFDLIADKYFPGSGFAHTMEKRSIEDHLAVSSSMANTFTFMNNPHIVKKGVPFILLETADWGPDYDAVLLTAEDFVKGNPWYPTKRIHFYEFFKDVRGRRVLSHCDDNDIQHHAFVDGNKLILIFNNQSNVEGTIDLDIGNETGNIKDIRLRHFARKPDLRPALWEERIFEIDQLEIGAREALALFIEYGEDVANSQTLNEVVHYGDQTSVQFSGMHDFSVNIPDPAQVEYAILRVGIGLPETSSKAVQISLNGTILDTPVEDAAERFSPGDYGSTRIVKVDPALLQTENTINVNFIDGQSGGVGAVVIRAGYASSDTLTSLELAREEISLFVQQEDSLQVNFFPETTGERSVNWESLDPAIASVSAQGIITGVAIGSTGIVVHSLDGSSSDTCMVHVKEQDLYSIADKSGWKVVYVDDEAYVNPMPGSQAIDMDPSTYWHTEWQVQPLTGLPHEIWVDMADTFTFEHFIYTPRQDQWGPNGGIGDYELYFSNDTANWGAAAKTGSFTWDVDGPDEYYKEIQRILLDAPVSARYFRLVALSEHQNIPEISHSAAAELDIGGQATGIRLEEQSLLINVGEEAGLIVRSLPFQGILGSEQFSWTTSNPTVASVSEGWIQGEGPGSCLIIASSFDGSFGDTCEVSVNIVEVDEIMLSAQTLTLRELEVAILEGAVLPSNAYHNSFRWRSDNEGVASVEMGYVTGLTAGTAWIIAESTDGIHADSCLVTVEVASYNVSVQVKDLTSAVPLEGATVSLGEMQATTTSEGLAAFTGVNYGPTQLQVALDQYRTHSSTIDLQSDLDKTVELERVAYQVELEVIEAQSGKPLPNASVKLGTALGMSDAEGRVDLLYPWGSFDLTVSKKYFETYTETLDIEGNTIFEIPVIRLLADAKFKVRDGNGILPGAQILLDGQEGSTSSLGIFTFKEQEVEKKMPYSISLDGYKTHEDELTLLTDTTLEVTLDLETGWGQLPAGSVRIYPVPADDHFFLEVEMEGLMQIHSLEGKLMQEILLKAGTHRIATGTYAPGIYLVKFENNKGAMHRLLPLQH